MYKKSTTIFLYEIWYDEICSRCEIRLNVFVQKTTFCTIQKSDDMPHACSINRTSNGFVYEGPKGQYIGWNEYAWILKLLIFYFLMNSRTPDIPDGETFRERKKKTRHFRWPKIINNNKPYREHARIILK